MLVEFELENLLDRGDQCLLRPDKLSVIVELQKRLLSERIHAAADLFEEVPHLLAKAVYSELHLLAHVQIEDVTTLQSLVQLLLDRIVHDQVINLDRRELLQSRVFLELILKRAEHCGKLELRADLPPLIGLEGEECRVVIVLQVNLLLCVTILVVKFLHLLPD